MFADDLHTLGDNYWKHVGVAEDVIKMGARYGMIKDSDAKRHTNDCFATGHYVFAKHDGSTRNCVTQLPARLV